jgi:hypothetical protein
MPRYTKLVILSVCLILIVVDMAFETLKQTVNFELPQLLLLLHFVLHYLVVLRGQVVDLLVSMLVQFI